MDSASAWNVFIDTGAPEMYLLYQALKRTEEQYVPEGTGPSVAGHKL